MLKLTNAQKLSLFESKVSKIGNLFRTPLTFTQQGGMQAWLDANAETEKLADMSISGFMLLLVPILFVIPIYLLSEIGQDVAKSIGVLIAFALAFTSVLAAGTPAKPHEILSCSAA